MLDINFFKKVGVNVVNMYRVHIFDKGKDIDDKKFDKYSTKYGERKRAKKFKRQANEFANTRSPVLTGDLYRDFKLIRSSIKKDGFMFGTVVHGGKVESLKELGRNLYRDKKVLPTHVAEYFEKEVIKYTEKKMKENFKGGRF